MISRKSRISLALYWEAHGPDFCGTVLEQNDVVGDSYEIPRDYRLPVLDTLRDLLAEAEDTAILNLLGYMGRNEADLRSRISPRYLHDQRWAELEGQLELDGVRLSEGGCSPLDPSLGEAGAIRDDLSQALANSRLPASDRVGSSLELSEKAYTTEPYDYNACLNNARVALQSLATDIATRRREVCGGSFQPEVWGQVLAYLRVSGQITRQEEEGISGIFTFLSPGSHRPIALDEREMARLGLTLAQSIIYFLLRIAEADPPCANT